MDEEMLAPVPTNRGAHAIAVACGISNDKPQPCLEKKMQQEILRSVLQQAHCGVWKEVWRETDGGCCCNSANRRTTNSSIQESALVVAGGGCKRRKQEREWNENYRRNNPPCASIQSIRIAEKASRLTACKVFITAMSMLSTTTFNRGE